MVTFSFSFFFSLKVGQDLADADNAEVHRRSLKNKVAESFSRINVVEQECQAEQNIQKQVICHSVLFRNTALMHFSFGFPYF